MCMCIVMTLLYPDRSSEATMHWALHSFSILGVAGVAAILAWV
jgi:hypothetical protein